MGNLLISILLYPYPYQYEAMTFSLLIFLIVGSIAYGIYKLITWKMNTGMRDALKGFLIIAGISFVVFFFIEIIISTITIYHVSKQLGFSYATPDTPEGELFEIQKVVPGKTMDKAGLKRFDQVQMWAVNDLYVLLIDNQRKEVVIPIVRNKKKIEIRLIVPELEVPLAGVSFWF